MSEERPVRQQTAVDHVAEGWVATLVDLDPTTATYIGVPGRTGEYGDTSPAGAAALADAARAAKRTLDAAAVVDPVDEVTKADLGAELDLVQESYARKLHLRDLNVIASPAQSVREIIDLMPTATESDWHDVASRLHALPDALEGIRETLLEGTREDVTPAKRQVALVAEQAARNGAEDGFFRRLAEGAAFDDGSPVPDSLRAELTRGAEVASAAYRSLGQFLEHELLPLATPVDAVGREAYELHSRRFLGAVVDLDETYEWGLEELARMRDEQERIADRIEPGASVARAIEVLDTDQSRILHGTDALQRWMQETSDASVAAMAGTYFDIPDPIRRLECRIAPTQEGGIYYSGPSDDFSRAGRMWWSVPEGVTEFGTWREKTTVYHEGVPGHHLQISQGVYNRGELNTWRRQLSGSSGHVEGWALYAERLMEQLGFLDDDGDRLGMLDGQRMRAARVVLDIGVHLQKTNPDGGGWTWEYALDFMRENVNMDDAFVQFEVARYFGWPGQAPSYKVGQRVWESIRDEVAAREGADFDLKSFHRRALALGSIGLDTLRSALLG
ncbi:uncharacterized protein (DUF885 family) [Curtobacterium sp. PhB42]|uniref:DUF885 domain-containing protein n=1 Tax=unclassified Curtobacterium TaxID=257496 RepID=UPI0010462FC9|nr:MULTISPECIES: DUF885 domain-containing protein [unclassified Curtobacterium]TCU84453.1 uncharacterized protein (DUF885 family) [Curtobacterium sp. PhB191]TDW38476.1 uncharacterized protein (DUF885 family) [Curtobacterium sp. PhB42]TDW48483.1 uncharacterized protein (DUF885 family) [Curtobacterium sp. PhB190]